VKRPELALRALAASGSARLKVAGEGPLDADLRRIARDLGIEERVDFVGWVSPDDLLALYASCRATLYVPVDEDYGYVPVESFLSGKPVITTSDAGGPLEFVEDGASGFVRPPTPGALAEAIDRVAALPAARLNEMGENGRRRVEHISWDAVVDRLTETIR
jgi:glycosyltransferase involved in cell wall biosynthesis